jgi:1-deoxy-D-xylulose-5-phosphate reductoisomerase
VSSVVERELQTLGLYGSTGSIGRQTLEVVRDGAHMPRIELLVAGRSVEELVAQAVEFRPRYLAVADSRRIDELKKSSPKGSEVITYSDAVELAATLDVTVNSVSGFAGLAVSESALRGGGILGLANKESIVTAGDLIAVWREKGRSVIVPIDSEHSAIYQCLGALGSDQSGRAEVQTLILTASGGPFRRKTSEELETVTLADALQHPTWSMGKKITVDSSTLVNKGLEVIEAHYLFGVDYGDIEVVVHPQSIVHSMVRFRDGAVLAQLSSPDMKLPISLALSFPDRGTVPYGSLDLTKEFELTFEPPDLTRFPALGLAYAAGRAGGSSPCWFNAANEVVVDAFLRGAISWRSIASFLADSLDRSVSLSMGSIEEVVEVDAQARAVTRALMKERTRGE